jgi:hypothetical protein
MISDVDKLQKYRKEVEEAKLDLAKLEGSRSTLMKRIQDEFGVSTLEEAKALLVKWREKRDKLETVFREKMKFIEDNYEI